VTFALGGTGYKPEVLPLWSADHQWCGPCSWWSASKP